MLNARERRAFTVPAGATSATFTWSYLDSRDNWFWAVDNVEVNEALPATVGTPRAVIDIISDIQGSLGNDHLKNNALPYLNSLTPAAGMLVANGDIVPDGAQANYTAYSTAFNAGGKHRSNNVLSTIGNHEYYGSGGGTTLRNRFLSWAGRDKVWAERVVGGVPCLAVGSEGYEYAEKTGSGPFVVFSAEQLSWLTSRLDYWAAQKQPVLLFCHQVLANSASGTYDEFYDNDFAGQQEQFEKLVLSYSNVVMFTSHTHWGLDRRDWEVGYRGNAEFNSLLPATGRALPIVNTGAVCNVYGPSGDYDESQINRSNSTGLRALVYSDRIRVQALDFLGRKVLKSIDLPLPVS